MTIQDIKQNLSIKQILEHYQIQEKNGMCRCPFHEDKTPSMQIFPDTNTVRCYSGNCQQSNKVIDVIDFIMYKEQLTKHEALLKASSLTDLSHKIQRTKEYQEIPLDRLEEIFYKMKSNLRQSKAARTYTEKRALDPERLEIGYNGRTYKGLVNCIVFPLKDPNNKIVSLYGRIIKDNTENKHYYLKNRQGLYPSYPKTDTQVLILTESIIDCASLLQINDLGITNHENSKSKILNILACYGVNGFTEQHKQAIQELKHLEEIIIIFDNDQAGKQATQKLAQELKTNHSGLQLTTIELPNKDVNETLQLHEPAVFKELIEKRKEILLSPEACDQAEQETSLRDTQEQETPQETGLSLSQINQLIGESGIIGEENTRLLLFIIASSYKTKSPLHAIVQGSSGSGKTHLISKIAELIPQEDLLKFTRITESSLYNWGEWDLVGKLIVIEDLDGLKEEALYSLRELISNQQLSSSVSIKDKKGNIKSTHKKVRGVFSSLSATTKADVYEDNISRSFILAVDESTAQSKKIIEYQNKKYAGEVSKTEEIRSKKQLQEYLRKLQNLEVINPYATKLELPQEVHKIRRLNQMYQSIIRQITYLNQRQRKYQDGKIYTEIEDLEQATEILFESILLKIDELDGSLRQFYEQLKKYLKDKNQEFTQREIRQYFNLSKAQCSRYINHLVSLEYIHSKNKHNLRKLTYQIEYWDDYEKLKKRIKEQLQAQIENLKKENITSKKEQLETIMEQ